MSAHKPPLIPVVLRLTLFWWIVFTVIAFGNDPFGVGVFVWENLSGFAEYAYQITFVGAASALVIGWIFYAKKIWGLKRLEPNKFMGLKSSVGKIPLPNPPLPRIKHEKERLPITGEHMLAWLNSQTTEVAAEKKGEAPKKELSAYGRLFMAIWDTYSAHAHYPASHRLGGHGDKRLHAHCHDVADYALKLAAEGWTYTGIYVKKRGRVARRIMEPNSTESVLNAQDPLIAIAALAHDIGKIIAYDVDDEGNIESNKEEDSNTLDDDDGRVLHDMLAPRALALMPEFWEITHRDRLALNMALAHYHHPSAFPLDRYKRLLDERAASVMALLIDADRQVSANEIREVGGALAEEMDEVQSEEIWQAFVKCITEFGRINGVGDPAKNMTVQIGQKHKDFIVIKEVELRNLVLQALNWTKEDNAERYYLTVKLLNVLMEKGLLYTHHNGEDFAAYLPMYRVAFYHDKKMSHITDFAPAVVIKHPPVAMEELQDLSFMAIHPAVAVIKHPTLTHLKTIKDREKLNAMITRAFSSQDTLQVAQDLVPGAEIKINEKLPEPLLQEPGAVQEDVSQQEQGDPAAQTSDAPAANDRDPIRAPSTMSVSGPKTANQAEEDAPSLPSVVRKHRNKPTRLTHFNAEDIEAINGFVDAQQEKITRKRETVSVAEAQVLAREEHKRSRAAAEGGQNRPRPQTHQSRPRPRQESEEQIESAAAAVNQKLTAADKKSKFGL